MTDPSPAFAESGAVAPQPATDDDDAPEPREAALADLEQLRLDRRLERGGPLVRVAEVEQREVGRPEPEASHRGTPTENARF